MILTSKVVCPVIISLSFINNALGKENIHPFQNKFLDNTITEERITRKRLSKTKGEENTMLEGI